jgi:hypothetical protein
MGKPSESGKGKLIYFNIKDESKEWEFANSGVNNFSKWVKDKIRETLGISNEESGLSETIKEEIRVQLQEALKSKINVQSEVTIPKDEKVIEQPAEVR